MGGFGDKPSVPGTGSVTGVLDKNAFKEFTLKEVIPYNHDSSTFIFEIPQDQNSGMTVASAVVVKGVGEQAPKDKEGKDVVRPYTPVTSPDTKGHIDFLIKKYPNGAMTQYIHAMKPGDKLEIKGPFDKHQYKANEFEEVAMIAGGSGITPMWQLLQAIKGNPQDKTKATLIYTNKTEADILLREKFDELAKSDDRFTIVYGLDKKPKNFTQADAFEGYVTPEILSKYLPVSLPDAYSRSSLVLITDHESCCLDRRLQRPTRSRSSSAALPLRWRPSAAERAPRAPRATSRVSWLTRVTSES